MLNRALLWAYRGLDELTDAHVMRAAHTTALERSDYPLRDSPPAPQEQSFALTRRRQTQMEAITQHVHPREFFLLHIEDS
jgi:hypothetical protein